MSSKKQIESWVGRIFVVTDSNIGFNPSIYEQRRALINTTLIDAPTAGMIIQNYPLERWDTEEKRYSKCMLEDGTICIIRIFNDYLT